jgi:hypothetical protein
MSAYIKNTEISQINDIMLHLKFLEKQEQAKPKISRRRKTIKIRAKINEIEAPPKKIQTLNKTRSWFSEYNWQTTENLTKIRKEKIYLRSNVMGFFSIINIGY